MSNGVVTVNCLMLRPENPLMKIFVPSGLKSTSDGSLTTPTRLFDDLNVGETTSALAAFKISNKNKVMTILIIK